MEVGVGEKGGGLGEEKRRREGRELGEEKKSGERREKSWEGRKEGRRIGGGGWNGMYGMKTQDLMPLGLDIG